MIWASNGTASFDSKYFQILSTKLTCAATYGRRRARLFGNAIVVEKVTIPCVNGRPKYGFIELSWAQVEMLDITDIMTVYSGVQKVNARRIYFRELRNKSNK